MKSSLIISVLFFFFHPSLQGQILKKLGDKVVNTVEKTVERKVEQKTEEKVNSTIDKLDKPNSNKTENTNQKAGTLPSTEKNQKNSSEVYIGYDAPQSTTKISPPELIRWLDLKVGKKFKEPEDKNLKQVIAVNPYLSPESPFFGNLFGLQSAPDGSLILGATAGLDSEGGVKGIGWRKIAPDGAITNFASRPYHSPHPGIYPSEKFSIASDGTLLTLFTEEIKSNRVGTKIVRVHSNGKMDVIADGLENPGMPVEDSKGNIWFSNKGGTELLRISPDGQLTGNLIGDQSWSNKELSPQERISLEYIAWDPIHNELVSEDLSSRRNLMICIVRFGE